MSAQLITINDTSLEQIRYQDQPVVTFRQIADVHGIPLDNVRHSFTSHRERFVEGKHYFRLDFAEANQLALNVTANPNGITLFTEKGYLLLVKPLSDDIAWQVQERMIDDYFALRTTVSASMTPGQVALALAQAVVDIEQKHLQLEATQHAQQRQLDAIEANLPDTTKQMSIKAFANLLGVRMTTAQASQLGKRCAGLSRAGGRNIGTLPDETYGQVNSYDRDILQAVFNDTYGGERDSERAVIINTGAEA